MHEMLGKTIHSHRVTEGGALLIIHTTKRRMVWECIAGCCSESWIEEILNPEFLRGKVLAVRELSYREVPEYPDSGRQEVDVTYGWAIDTSLGTATVIFRNSSNGYYSGCLELQSSYEDETSD
jgi:hypothetical protein